MSTLPHEWIKSTLGHGEAMCKHCYITNRGAAAVNQFECTEHPMLKTHPNPANMNVDGRDPDPRRFGVFRDHNCARCHSGERPCVLGPGRERDCGNLHARND